MNNVEKQIAKHNKLEKAIKIILNKVTISDEDKKDLLFIGFFNNYMCHFKSITLLMEKKLYNTAFALIRVLFENAVRAIYMHETFEDKKIDRMYDNMYNKKNWKDFDRPITVDSMCKKLDERYASDNNIYFKEIKDNAYSAMNDYTHTGANQIARNFDGISGLTTNFSESMLLDTLESTYNLSKVFAIIFYEKIGLKQDVITKEDLEKFTERY